MKFKPASDSLQQLPKTTPSAPPNNESDTDSDSSYTPGSSIVVVSEGNFDDIVNTVEAREATEPTVISGDEEEQVRGSSQLPGFSGTARAALSSRVSEASFESVAQSLGKAKRKRSVGGSFVRNMVNMLVSNSSSNIAVVQDVDENVERLIQESQQQSTSQSKEASRGKGASGSRGRGKHTRQTSAPKETPKETERTFVPPQLKNSPSVAKIIQTFEKKKKHKKARKEKSITGKDIPVYTYIRHISLMRNNAPMDNFVNGATLLDDKNAYVQLLNNMNYIRSGSEGGGIDYKEFIHGNYIRAWDLTTSGPGNTKNMQPTVVATNYSIDIQFTKPLEEPVKILIISEKPAIMTVAKSGATGVSYLG